MKALLYGVRPDPVPEPDTDNHLLRDLAQTPMRLVDIDDPGFLLPDWVVTRPRLTGICGSDSKQVFMDWGEVRSPDNPMKGVLLAPAGARARGRRRRGRARARGRGPRGRRPRRAEPVAVVRAARRRRRSARRASAATSACAASFGVGPIAPGIHIGTSKDATGGYAELMPAHDSMLFKVPDDDPDELAVFADPFAVLLHAITRHPPPPGGKVMVYGAGALGTCATAILRALYPDVEVLVVARFEAQAAMARKLGATVIGHTPALRGHRRSGGVVGRRAAAERRAADGVSRARSTSCTTRSASRRRSRSGRACCKARGTLVKAGVHGPTWWEDTPLYFKEISMVGSNAFGFEEVDGVRKHGIDALPRPRRRAAGSISPAC